MHRTRRERPDLPPPGKLIEFTCRAPQAHAVAVAGSFNEWDPRRTPLEREEEGLWRVRLPLSPGRYEYRFVVDGQWQEDAAAREFAPNPFGGRNAVLVVPPPPRRFSAAAVAA